MTLLHSPPDTRPARRLDEELVRGHDLPALVCGGKDSSAGTACSFPPRWQLGAPVLGFACNVHAIWTLDRQLTEGHSVTMVKLARHGTQQNHDVHQDDEHQNDHHQNHDHNQETTS
jgi:hypothetical protein